MCCCFSTQKFRVLYSKESTNYTHLVFSQKAKELSFVSDLLCNDELSSRKMKQLSSVLLSSYIMFSLRLCRPGSGLLNMQQILFLPWGWSWWSDWCNCDKDLVTRLLALWRFTFFFVCVKKGLFQQSTACDKTGDWMCSYFGYFFKYRPAVTCSF